MDYLVPVENVHVDILYEIGRRLATSDPLHDVLARLLDFTTRLVSCDSCPIYVPEGEENSCAPDPRIRHTMSVLCHWTAISRL
jgi:hypothetical protein